MWSLEFQLSPAVGTIITGWTNLLFVELKRFLSNYQLIAFNDILIPNGNAQKDLYVRPNVINVKISIVCLSG